MMMVVVVAVVMAVVMAVVTAVVMVNGDEESGGRGKRVEG